MSTPGDVKTKGKDSKNKKKEKKNGKGAAYTFEEGEFIKDYEKQSQKKQADRGNIHHP